MRPIYTIGRIFIEMERVAGIEPACTAWKAADQPMIQTRLGTPRLR